MSASMLTFMRRCGAIAGASLGAGAFAPGPAIWVGTREVAHFDERDELDVRLTRQVISARRAELQRDDRIELRKSTSDWLRVRVRTTGDRTFAFALVRDAVAANR